MYTLQEWNKGGTQIDFRGHRIHCRFEGAGEEKLVCLHGFPTSSHDYHKIWDDLTRHFSVVTFDLIGYGFSEKPSDFPYTTFDQADLLETVIRHFGLTEFNILAHDYGNTITQEILARQIESPRPYEIKSVCFLNGALFPETHRPILAQKILISPIGGLFGRLIPESAFRRALASVFGPETQPTDEELDDFMELFRYNGGRKISHKLIRYMSERAEHRDRWVGALDRLPERFRFINGLADPVSGRHLVARFRELFPERNDIVELESIGHFPHLEKPAAVLNSFLEFHELQ